ncbi:ThuA domain-containing protein [Chitinophaga silvatica]|uniref:ThuA domain-containing protein n=2 Tax=Chitinophaga silvatica TaxID=2282649 RepID=A0A3E1YI26_9BACT|nr:ThuA domain-containing protein [Chitinophaga silvatica]
MKILLCLILCLTSNSKVVAQSPLFRVLAFYNTRVEPDHVDFARDAISFYKHLATERHFQFDTTTDWSRMNPADLKKYEVVLWLNFFPTTAEQRNGFTEYMEKGGGWIGFHVAGYNDKYTQWPWFVQFMGGAVFHNNNWPPLPARLHVEPTRHQVTRHLPADYVSPANEWYQWIPSPREQKDIQVLVTLDPSNYPLGRKNLLTFGDIPVVWTNKKFHMLYINMGHGDKIFTDSVQNKMYEDAIMWVGQKAGKSLLNK